MILGDGCSGSCQVENGYVCRATECTHLISKVSEAITSVGVNMNFIYNFPQLANSGNLLGVTVTNGPTPSSIKIIRPLNDSSSMRVLLDYCGLLPPENITVELSSNSQIGNVKYVNVYDL